MVLFFSLKAGVVANIITQEGSIEVSDPELRNKLDMADGQGRTAFRIPSRGLKSQTAVEHSRRAYKGRLHLGRELYRTDP